MKHFSIQCSSLFLIFSLSAFSGYSGSPVENSKLKLVIDRASRLMVVATNHDSASVMLNNADELAKATNNLHQQNNILMLKGLNEYYSSNYEQAMDYYYKALGRAEQANDSSLISNVYHKLGMIFDKFEDHDEAIQHYQKSNEISTVLKDTALTAKNYQNTAISFQNKKDYKKAFDYTEKANNLAIKKKDTLMIIDLTSNFGTIAYYQKKLDESLKFYRKALELYQNLNNRPGVARAYNNIGLAYLDKKDYKLSLQYFKKSLALANELKMYDFTGSIYSNLTVYYGELKDYKNAYLCYDKFNVVYDSLIGEKKHKTIRQIQARYQLEKSNRDLQELKKANLSQLNTIRSAQIIQIYLVVISILVVLLLLSLIYLFRKEKKLAAELKSKSEELHDLNVAKDKFFSIIAHDLKNPFNVLVSYTSILKTDLNMFSQEELKQIISDLNSASENGFNLLQNLLLWTRSQTNRLSIYKTRFQLNDLIHNVKALVELNLMAKNQRLEIKIDNDSCVFADKDMIATVLRNLVFNAIKFSPKGSEIRIETTSEKTMVRVDVIDSGVGISSKLIDKLFQIDNQTNTPGTDGETGTGLGLLICREFVEKNGGKISVVSEPGKGSVFSFTVQTSL